MINHLISSVSEKSLSNFIRTRNSSFIEYKEDLSHLVANFEQFGRLSKLGEIQYDNTDVLLVFACFYKKDLSSRSARKMQFEIAKKALKEDFKDGAVFVFYDEAGNFRFSFIRKNYGDKAQKYSPWKRYTYFVKPDAKTNRTFIERIGSCMFDSLENIQKAFSVEQLTKDFYKELSDWYFWAIKNVSFPNDISDDSDEEKYNSENIIRLITRLIFVWFLKQKGLIRNELFDTNALQEILKDFDAESETQNNYYRAILQNLFFATLNQEIGKRDFAEDKGFVVNRSNNAIKNLYRYENEFLYNTTQVMELFSKVPFLNGGLFECLDRKEKEGKYFDWDGFSRTAKYQAKIPNALFFAKDSKVDLSIEYDDEKMKAVKVAGIIEILNRYNFTVEENTPVEIEVALDPELLGKVFENLLGAFNPETQETAKKQTGSFYTPREIVNYMVDESLIAYFQTKVPDLPEDALRLIFSYEDEVAEVDEAQRESLIQAAFDCKILDPACGSGAFPMGILQQMVHVLKKLDPENTHWNKVVMSQAMKDFEKADKISDEDIEAHRKEIEKTFDDGLNYPDYARKLHVIENCIYGVDIQSIAVQISKLRFFISLVCEQRKNEDATENFGIRPLPNLETKFVTASTLIRLKKTEEDLQLFGDSQIKKLIDLLQHVRHRLFLVTNATEKKRLRDKDQKLREDIENEISKLYVKHKDEHKAFYTIQKALAEKELELIDKTIVRSIVSTDIFGEQVTKTYKPNDKRKKELNDTIKIATKKIEEASDYSRLKAVVALARQLTSWNPYDQNGSSPFFDPEWMFGLFEQNEGYFDVVIGNPPYISAPQMVKTNLELRNAIKKCNCYHSLYQKWDLYIPFMEYGLQILSNNGVFTMIVPYPLTNQSYGMRLREMILNKYCLIEIVDLNGTKIFENATVSNIIPKIYKSTPKESCYISKINTNAIIPIIQREFIQNYSDLVQDKKTLVWNLTKEKRDSDCHTEMNVLGDYCYISKGMVLNSDEKTAKGEFTKDDLISESFDQIHCRKYIEAKDIERYKIKKIRYLEYNTKRCPDKISRPTFRELYEKPKLMFNRLGALMVYLDDNTKFLHSDSMYSGVLWKDLAGVNNKSISASVKRYSNHSRKEMESYSEKINLYFLLGLLNSKYASVLLSNLRGGDYHVYPEHLRNLPIPLISDTRQRIIVSLVEKIIDSKLNHKNADQLEQQIDNYVYRLYNLSYKEVKVIDPEIEAKISEEDYIAINID